MALVVRPLTPELWPALEHLFGKKGASNGCWCMYWRIGRAYAERPREENRREFQAVVESGPPPGLLAMEGEVAMGWCQVTLRRDIPYVETKRFFAPPDEAPVWAISCFYVRAKGRRQGVAKALIEAAVAYARQAGAPALEAYPVDVAQPKATSNAFTGVASSFVKAGFREVARRAPSRPLMRLDLR